MRLGSIRVSCFKHTRSSEDDCSNASCPRPVPERLTAEVDADIATFAKDLANAEPSVSALTGDRIVDLSILHSAVRQKLERLMSDKYLLNLAVPHDLTHVVDPETGKWKKIGDGAVISYEVLQVGEGSCAQYLEFAVGGEPAAEIA